MEDPAQATPHELRLPIRADWVEQLPVIDAGDTRTEWLVLTVLGLGVLLLGLAYVQLLSRRRRNQVSSELVGMNQAIAEQQAEIEAQHQAIQAINTELLSTLQQVSQQRAALERQQTRLAESIRYASRIQQSILPDAEQLAHWPPHVIVYQPLPEVSGDFYWTERQSDNLLIGVVACRGNQMPGAFLSVLGASLLHQLAGEGAALDELLLSLDRRLRASLHARQAASTLSVALLRIAPPDSSGQRRIGFASAGLPVFRQRNGTVERLTSSTQPCGGQANPFPEPKLIEWTTIPGERLFLLTNGMLDRWQSSTFEEQLASMQALTLSEAGHQLENELQRHQQPDKQAVDLLAIGLEL